jgi:hypothetical protein
MNRGLKATAATAVFLGMVYTGLTWFYFGSPHPCTIATRVLERELAGHSEEWWLGFARSLALIHVNHTTVDEAQRAKLAEYLETAPPEIVHKYADTQKFIGEMINNTKNETPAHCVEMLYGRIKAAVTGKGDRTSEDSQ